MCGCQEGKNRQRANEDEDARSQIDSEVSRLGRRELLRKVRESARRTMANMPDTDEITKLDAVSRQYIERVSILVEAGMKASEWPDEELSRFAGEMAWATLATRVTAIALDNGGGGGGGGGTCATRCLDQYNECVKELECETGGLVCICCIPCSLELMGCMARCTVGSGGIIQA